MALLKKVDSTWEPIEAPGLKVGEVFESTNYQTLVEEGKAVLVDKMGNEMEVPGKTFECPICFEVLDGATEFTQHVAKHAAKNVKRHKERQGEQKEEDEKSSEKKELTIREKRLKALEKARKVKAENLRKKKEAEKDD